MWCRGISKECKRCYAIVVFQFHFHFKFHFHFFYSQQHFFRNNSFNGNVEVEAEARTRGTSSLETFVGLLCSPSCSGLCHQSDRVLSNLSNVRTYQLESKGLRLVCIVYESSLKKVRYREYGGMEYTRSYGWK